MNFVFGLFRFALAVFAVLLIIAGLIIMPTPLPFGIVLVALGFILLALVAPSAIRLLRRMRWFDRLMHWLEKHLPGWLARRLRESDVEHHDEK